MGKAGLITMVGIMSTEWRIYRRSPVCLIGLLAAVGFMLTESRSSAGWPSLSTSLYGFQSATSLLVGIIAFLLAAGSLARDLDPGWNQLLFSRPISIPVYLAGKLAATISFGFFLVAVLLLTGLCRPFFSGVWTVYPPAPFLKVTVLCGIPLVVYVCSLAMFLTAMFGRVIVAFPAFLLYFISVALMKVGGGGDVDFLDFSMRLNERYIAVSVPIQLSDSSFAHLLDPVQPGLIIRCLLYLALSVVLAAGAGWMIARRRNLRPRRRMKRRDRADISETRDGNHGERVIQPYQE